MQSAAIPNVLSVDQEVGGSNPPSCTSATCRKAIAKELGWNPASAVKADRKPMSARPAEFGRGPNRPSRLNLIDGIAGDFAASIGHAQMV
jgi:hypothetical protein